MHNIIYKTPRRLALFLLAVAWSALFSSAQAPKPVPETVNTASKPIPFTQTNDAKLTHAPGKMRGLTNDMRWAAAVRTADRRAKAHGKGHKSGVKP